MLAITIENNKKKGSQVGNAKKIIWKKYIIKLVTWPQQVYQSINVSMYLCVYYQCIYLCVYQYIYVCINVSMCVSMYQCIYVFYNQVVTWPQQVSPGDPASLPHSGSFLWADPAREVRRWPSPTRPSWQSRSSSRGRTAWTRSCSQCLPPGSGSWTSCRRWYSRQRSSGLVWRPEKKNNFKLQLCEHYRIF